LLVCTFFPKSILETPPPSWRCRYFQEQHPLTYRGGTPLQVFSGRKIFFRLPSLIVKAPPLFPIGPHPASFCHPPFRSVSDVFPPFRDSFFPTSQFFSLTFSTRAPPNLFQTPLLIFFPYLYPRISLGLCFTSVCQSDTLLPPVFFCFEGRELSIIYNRNSTWFSPFVSSLFANPFHLVCPIDSFPNQPLFTVSFFWGGAFLPPYFFPFFFPCLKNKPKVFFFPPYGEGPFGGLLGQAGIHVFFFHGFLGIFLIARACLTVAWVGHPSSLDFTFPPFECCA